MTFYLLKCDTEMDSYKVHNKGKVYEQASQGCTFSYILAKIFCFYSIVSIYLVPFFRP